MRNNMECGYKAYEFGILHLSRCKVFKNQLKEIIKKYRKQGSKKILESLRKQKERFSFFEEKELNTNWSHEYPPVKYNLVFNFRCGDYENCDGNDHSFEYTIMGNFYQKGKPEAFAKSYFSGFIETEPGIWFNLFANCMLFRCENES
jgi:hypothetical protein